MAEYDRHIVILPWLGGVAPFDLGDFRIQQYMERERRPFGPDSPDQDHLQDVASCYGHLFQGRIRSLGECTVVHRKEGDPWNISESEFRDLGLSLAATGVFHRNCVEPELNYANGSGLVAYAHPFAGISNGVSTIQRRRMGSERTAFPRHTFSAARPRWACADSPCIVPWIANAFYELLTTGSEEGQQKWKRALDYMVVANTDDPSLTTRAELLLLGCALEAIFERTMSGRTKVRGKRTPNSVVIRDQISSKIQSECLTDSKSTIEDWFDDFVRVRGKSAHGHPYRGTDKPPAYTTSDEYHCVLATEAIGLLALLEWSGSSTRNSSIGQSKEGNEVRHKLEVRKTAFPLRIRSSPRTAGDEMGRDSDGEPCRCPWTIAEMKAERLVGVNGARSASK